MATPPVRGLAVAERRVEHPRASIICVHGGLDRGGSFARIARRLEQFDLVTYDRRGYQGSRSLGVGTHDEHVADLLAIIRAERQSSRVLVFGHSAGGVVALGAATAASSLVDLVVAYESPLAWVLARERSRPLLGEDPREEAEIFFTRMVSRSAWERLSDVEKESRRADGPALLADLRSVRGSAPFDLGNLTAPAAYAHGDGIIAPYYRELAALLARRFSMRTVEMTGAGHGAHLANPDQLAELLSTLWNETCASA